MRLLARLIVTPILTLLIAALVRVPLYLIKPELGDVSFFWLVLALYPSIFALLGGSRRWAARLFTWVTLAFWGLASGWALVAIGGPIAQGVFALVLLGSAAYVLAELGRLRWALGGLISLARSALGLAYHALRRALNLPLGGEVASGYMEPVTTRVEPQAQAVELEPRLSRERREELDSQLVRLDMSARRVLEVLLTQEGLSKSELARRADIGRRHAIRAVAELEELGWVETRPGRVDTRGGSRLATLVFLRLGREERLHLARRLEELRREGRAVL